MATKKITTVWNEKPALLEMVRKEVINSYNNNTPLDENISDMFSYRVFETESDIKLIIELI